MGARVRRGAARPGCAPGVGPDGRSRRLRLPRARRGRPRVRGRARRDPVARAGRFLRDRRLRRGDPAREGRLAAAPVAARRRARRGGVRSPHRARDRQAARRIRRRQHLDPQLDRPADAHVVPRHLGRSAGARDARGERARPHAHADGALRARRHAARGRGPRLRRALAPRAGPRARRRPGRGRRGRGPGSSGRTPQARSVHDLGGDRRPGRCARRRALPGGRPVRLRARALVPALRRGDPRRGTLPPGPGRRARRHRRVLEPGRGDRLRARAASGAAGGDADRLRDARRARARRRGAPPPRRCLVATDAAAAGSRPCTGRGARRGRLAPAARRTRPLEALRQPRGARPARARGRCRARCTP